MSDSRRLVDKLWSYCNVLRDDGVSTIDDVEQLTYLLFLKMAYERETRPLRPEQVVPADCSWQRLLDADGNDLETTYRRVLQTLGRQQGVLGVVFRKAQNKVQDPAKLKRLVVDLIGKENWRTRRGAGRQPGRRRACAASRSRRPGAVVGLPVRGPAAADPTRRYGYAAPTRSPLNRCGFASSSRHSRPRRPAEQGTTIADSTDATATGARCTTSPAAADPPVSGTWPRWPRRASGLNGQP